MQLTVTLPLASGSCWLRWRGRVGVSGDREAVQGGLGEQRTHSCRRVIWFTGLQPGGGPVGEGGHSRQSRLPGRGREVTLRGEMGFRKKTQAIWLCWPGTATYGTCTNLGKLGMFEFPSPHPFHRNFFKKCKRQWPNPSHWAALWFHIWIFSQLQGGNLSICPNILTELQEKLSKTVEDTGCWRSLKMVSVARLWVPI